MKIMLRLVLLSLTAGLCVSANPFWPHQPNESSFFVDESMLQIRLKGDWKALFKDKDKEPSYHAFEFSMEKEDGSWLTVPVRVKVRGNFRKDNCSFPPIRLNFKKKEVKGTYLEGLDKIKLVHPCHNKDRYEPYVLTEYLSYKGYNVMTDSSFRARLARLTYEGLETKDGAPLQRYAFFIEPTEWVAERVGGEQIEPRLAYPSQLNTRLSLLLSIYNYALANTDWSIVKPHNIKLFRTEPGLPALPIPYDFDWSGLVNAPYPRPDESLGITSIKERLYRGFCYDEAATMQAIEEFKAKEAEIMALFEQMSFPDEKYKAKTIEYLAEFFDVIKDEKKLSRSILSRCRTSPGAGN